MPVCPKIHKKFIFNQDAYNDCINGFGKCFFFVREVLHYLGAARNWELLWLLKSTFITLLKVFLHAAVMLSTLSFLFGLKKMVIHR